VVVWSEVGAKGFSPLYLSMFLFLFFWLLSTVTGAVFAAESPPLRICFLTDNLPFSSRQQNSGFDLDTAKAVAETLGRPLAPVWVANSPHIDEIEESDFPLHRLSRHVCDALFSIPGPEVVKGTDAVTVGAPYYGAAFEMIARAGEVTTSLDSVGDAPIAVQSTTIANFVLNARQAQIRTFFSVKAALEAVAAGDAPIALLWGPTAGWHVQEHPEMQLAVANNVTPPVVMCWNQHVATRKEDAVLRTAIDDALARLSKSGTLRTLLARYGIPLRQPFATTYSLAEMQKLRVQGPGDR
jgi:polar amino acid transport system substrate-binding protein